MALDTQPLSRERRLVMVGVLAALFAGSLGFAQFLVVKQSAGVDVVPVLEKVGFTTVESPTFQYEIAARSGKVEKRERLVEVFSWPSPKALSAREQTAAAGVLFEELTSDQPETIEPGTLLGRPAVQAVGKDDQDQFTIVRLAAIDRQLVAISYSGPLPYTDADKTSFNAICATGVELRK
jgi:hypothetical protein